MPCTAQGLIHDGFLHPNKCQCTHEFSQVYTTALLSLLAFWLKAFTEFGLGRSRTAGGRAPMQLAIAASLRWRWSGSGHGGPLEPFLHSLARRTAGFSAKGSLVV